MRTMIIMMRHRLGSRLLIIRRWWDFNIIKGRYEDQGSEIGIRYWWHRHDGGLRHLQIEISAGVWWIEIRIGRYQ